MADEGHEPLKQIDMEWLHDAVLDGVRRPDDVARMRVMSNDSVGAVLRYWNGDQK